MNNLEIYDCYQANWAIWTYKDIGLQSVVYTAPDLPWRKLLQPLLEKKARLGVDSWGAVDTHIRYIMQALEETFAKEFPDYHPSHTGRFFLGRTSISRQRAATRALPPHPRRPRPYADRPSKPFSKKPTRERHPRRPRPYARPVPKRFPKKSTPESYHPFPFGSQWMINRLVRHILLAEPLLSEFAALFRGMDEQAIDP